MRTPSVIFLNRVYPPLRGATGRVLHDLAGSFARQGWQVTVVTTGPAGSSEASAQNGVRVVRLRGKEKPSGVIAYTWLWLKMLVFILRAPAPSLLVTMSDPPMLAVIGHIAKKFKGCRHINWCHDLYPDILPALDVKMPGFLMRFLKSLSMKALQNADRVIVIGRCMAKRVVREGLDVSKVTMIPNWPNFELVEPPAAGTENQQPLHSRLINGSKPHAEQIKTGPRFRVLYAGNIGRAHPIDTILGAAALLNEENPEIEFVFVGDGARFDEVARERDRLNIENIRFLPYQPAERLRAVMESGDLHLVSIKADASGLLVPSKLYSALAVERPCIFIGPASSEAAKVIKDYKAGRIVPQGNAKALAQYILHYRMNGDDWFAAQKGAVSAGQIFVPKDAIKAWMDRAWSVVETDLKTGT